MKKVFLVLALGAFTFSCGSKEEKSEKDEDKVELTSEDVVKDYCECIEKAELKDDKLEKCTEDLAEKVKHIKGWTGEELELGCP